MEERSEEQLIAWKKWIKEQKCVWMLHVVEENDSAEMVASRYLIEAYSSHQAVQEFLNWRDPESFDTLADTNALISIKVESLQCDFGFTSPVTWCNDQ